MDSRWQQGQDRSSTLRMVTDAQEQSVDSIPLGFTSKACRALAPANGQRSAGTKAVCPYERLKREPGSGKHPEYVPRVGWHYLWGSLNKIE